MDTGKPVKAILFDFGGTLDADGVPWKDRFHGYYRDEGLALDADAFAPHYYAADDSLVGGVPETLGFDATVERLTANLEAGCGATNPERGRRVAARFTADSRATVARNARTLAALGEQYKLGIVSNFYGNLAAVCRDVGIERYLAVAVDSERVGVEKPEPAIFQAALNVIEAQPEECIFVGDSLRRDRTGARNMGMRFVWVAPPEAREQPDASADDPVIGSVAELIEVLP